MALDQATIDRLAAAPVGPGKLLIGGDWVDGAGATFQAPIISGKFQGTIAPTTPTGSRWISPSTFGAVGATSP